MTVHLIESAALVVQVIAMIATLARRDPLGLSDTVTAYDRLTAWTTAIPDVAVQPNATLVGLIGKFTQAPDRT